MKRLLFSALLLSLALPELDSSNSIGSSASHNSSSAAKVIHDCWSKASRMAGGTRRECRKENALPVV